MLPYKVNFELSAAGVAELNSQVRHNVAWCSTTEFWSPLNAGSGYFIIWPVKYSR